MKRILSLSVLSVLLAACTTPSEIPPESGEPGASGARPASVDGPLVVPALSSLPDTPPRALAGKYKAGTWAEMPGWTTDDLAQIWPLFLRNCKGLMRPTAATWPRRRAPHRAPGSRCAQRRLILRGRRPPTTPRACAASCRPTCNPGA